MPRARLLVLPALLLIAVLLAACGGAGGAADADPAKAVPAGTAIYIEGVIRPEGDQRDDLMDAARALATDALAADPAHVATIKAMTRPSRA